MKTLVAYLMTLIMSISGIGAFSAADVIDGISEMIFGMPVSSDSLNDSFVTSYTESDIRQISDDSGFVKNRLILFLNPQSGVLKKYIALRSENVRVVGWCTLVDIYAVSCKAETENEIIELCEKLESHNEVLKALPMMVSEIEPTGTPDDPFETDTEYNPVYWDELNPAGRNWWLEAVDARQAWDYSSYFKNVKLGVVDSGFNTDNPELKGKITFPSARLEKRNVSSYHGTHVSGIMAAEMNNQIGIAGLCPTASLVCVDWEPEGEQRWNSTIAVILGLVQTVKAGAKAVNFSVGMSGSVKSGQNKLNNFSYFATAGAVSYCMAALLSKGYDFLLVHSAGNGNKDAVAIDARNSGYMAAVNEDTCFTGLYKVSYDDIISRIIVAGSAINNGRRKYIQSPTSNSGPEVTIAAPGVNIYSCYYTDGEDFAFLSGTSMAAPVVTATAGLIWSVNPDFTGAEVKDIIVSSTDCVAAKADGENYIGEYGLRDLDMVNSKLCVEEALKRTYNDIGMVNGSCDIDDAEFTTVSFGGVDHTVYSDGSFSFAAESGTGTITVKDGDGNVLSTAQITVTAGKTTNIDLKEVIPETA